jgi:hypothetical protein
MSSAVAGFTQVNTLATHTALTVWAYVGNFFALLVLAGVFFLIARYVGRGPFVALLLSLYAGYAVYATFPYEAFLPTAPAVTAFAAHTGVYFAMVVAFYLILRRVVVSDFLYIGLFGLIALSFLGAAFLLALGYHVFAAAHVYQFPAIIQTLFAPKQYFFWWFIALAIGLFFIAR